MRSHTGSSCRSVKVDINSKVQIVVMGRWFNDRSQAGWAALQLEGSVYTRPSMFKSPSAKCDSLENVCRACFLRVAPQGEYARKKNRRSKAEDVTTLR